MSSVPRYADYSLIYDKWCHAHFLHTRIVIRKTIKISKFQSITFNHMECLDKYFKITQSEGAVAAQTKSGEK